MNRARQQVFGVVAGSVLVAVFLLAGEAPALPDPKGSADAVPAGWPAQAQAEESPLLTLRNSLRRVARLYQAKRKQAPLHQSRPRCWLSMNR